MVQVKSSLKSFASAIITAFAIATLGVAQFHTLLNSRTLPKPFTGNAEINALTVLSCIVFLIGVLMLMKKIERFKK